MAFDLSQYDPVENRIHAFWKEHETGRIHTEIVLINETEIVIKASIYADREDPRAVAIGFAQETRKSNPLSFAEVCETSAIGRALANLGYSPNIKNKSLRASREEMEKVQRGSLHIARNWDAELEALTAQKSLEGLRELRKDAVRSLQPKEFIDAIDAAGNKIKEAAKADTPK